VEAATVFKQALKKVDVEERKESEGEEQQSNWGLISSQLSEQSVKQRRALAGRKRKATQSVGRESSEESK
jgi:hypothetical protein